MWHYKTFAVAFFKFTNIHSYYIILTIYFWVHFPMLRFFQKASIFIFQFERQYLHVTSFPIAMMFSKWKEMSYLTVVCSIVYHLIMARYTRQERLNYIQKLFAQTSRSLRENFGIFSFPTFLAIRRIVKQFESEFTL